MAVLYGTQSDGTLIPVQADSQGRLVAELANRDTAPSYQDGFWYPTMGTTNGGFVGTYSTQLGNFYRIGQWVHIQFTLTNDTIQSTGSGSLGIADLPYLPDSLSAQPTYSGGLTIRSGFDSGFTPDILAVWDNDFGACARLQYWSTTDDASRGIAGSRVNSGFKLRGVVTYRTADTTFAPINGAILR